jgi:ABC-type multidrug transport system ATPase subunit
VTGYCPQHSPLYDDLSIRTHLRFYAGIRGIADRKQILDVTESLMASLKISGEFQDQGDAKWIVIEVVMGS